MFPCIEHVYNIPRYKRFRIISNWILVCESRVDLIYQISEGASDSKKKERKTSKSSFPRNRISTNVNICPLYETSLLRTYVERERESILPSFRTWYQFLFLPPVILSRAKAISELTPRLCLLPPFFLSPRLWSSKLKTRGRRLKSSSAALSCSGLVLELWPSSPREYSKRDLFNNHFDAFDWTANFPILSILSRNWISYARIISTFFFF